MNGRKLSCISEITSTFRHDHVVHCSVVTSLEITEPLSILFGQHIWTTPAGVCLLARLVLQLPVAAHEIRVDVVGLRSTAAVVASTACVMHHSLTAQLEVAVVRRRSTAAVVAAGVHQDTTAAKVSVLVVRATACNTTTSGDCRGRLNYRDNIAIGVIAIAILWR